MAYKKSISWERNEKGCLICTSHAGIGGGYPVVCINYQSVQISRLICIRRGAKDKFKAIHSCDNSRCINPSHIRAGTTAENNKDCRSKDRHTRGSRHPFSKLTESDATEIFNSTETEMATAKRFGVSQALVHKIKTKACWKHIH